MKGIYIFTNKINKKQYIGQSVQIKNRYNQHRRNAFNPACNEYNNHFHRAIRKYGFENFDFDILITNDNFTKKDLNELEIFYIKQFKTFQEGYNQTRGGQYTDHLTKLKIQDAQGIQQLIQNTNQTFEQIGALFDVSSDLVGLINKGAVWVNNSLIYPLRDTSLSHARGERVSTAICSDQEILEIREKFVNHTLEEIYEEYKNKYSFSGLKKIVYGVNHKHLPIYKKRTQQWILNGTCIDYPE